MDKSDIINKIDLLMDNAYQLDNYFFYNNLFSIKCALIKEWSESDLYFQIITEELKKT
jgi:hypothetical protein